MIARGPRPGSVRVFVGSAKVRSTPRVLRHASGAKSFCGAFAGGRWPRKQKTVASSARRRCRGDRNVWPEDNECGIGNDRFRGGATTAMELIQAKCVHSRDPTDAQRRYFAGAQSQQRYACQAPRAL